MNSKIRYISFDIFDTLLSRSVTRPKDIFSIVGNHIIQMYQKELIPDFPSVRCNAENEARTRVVGEITIDDIYEVIAEKFNLSDVEEYKKYEIKTEIDLIAPNYPIKQIYESYKQKGYDIVIISDMYLPKTVISTMLNKCGYIGYKHLYVSSETKVRKSTGEMFDYVLKDLSVNGCELLHIGDSLRSDIIMAKSRGIR